MSRRSGQRVSRTGSTCVQAGLEGLVPRSARGWQDPQAHRRGGGDWSVPQTCGSRTAANDHFVFE